MYAGDIKVKHRMIRTSILESKQFPSEQSSRTIAFSPLVRSDKDTFIKITNYQNLVDSMIYHSQSDFESGADFDVVIIVDPHYNFTEHEAIVPLSFYAKKLILIGGNSDEKKPNLFRILSKNLKPIDEQDKNKKELTNNSNKRPKQHSNGNHTNLHPAVQRQLKKARIS